MNDGGSEFPGKGPNGEDVYGMTLRDYFAAKAMPIAIQHLHGEPDSEVDEFRWRGDDGRPSSDANLAAEYAYAMADAMIEARQ